MSVGFHKGVHMVKNTKIFLSKVMGQRGYLLLGLFKSVRIITPKCLCNSVFLMCMSQYQSLYFFLLGNKLYNDRESRSLLFLQFLEQNNCVKNICIIKEGRNELIKEGEKKLGRYHSSELRF